MIWNDHQKTNSVGFAENKYFPEQQNIDYLKVKIIIFPLQCKYFFTYMAMIKSHTVTNTQ